MITYPYENSGETGPISSRSERKFCVMPVLGQHLTTWDNCGPVITAGVGVGIPIKLGGLINRAVLFSRW